MTYIDKESYLSFADDFCKTYSYPEECTQGVIKCLDTVLSSEAELPEFLKWQEFLFAEKREDPATVLIPPLKELAERLGLYDRMFYLAFYIFANKRLGEMFDEMGIAEDVKYETFRDFFFKIGECHMLTGTWGLYTPQWFYGYYTGRRFAFGRLQFEIVTLTHEEGVEIGGKRIEKGDNVIAIHIPRSPDPFDAEARLNAYRGAYEFFKSSFPDKEIPFTCKTWLFYPLNKEILKPTANIVGFMNEFKMMKTYHGEAYWLWRIFGVLYTGNPDDMPEDNSLKRGYKKWLKDGNMSGSSYGIMLFDGEKIISE